MTNLKIVVGLLAGILCGILLVIFNPFAGDRLLRSVAGGKYYSYTSSDVYGMRRSIDDILNLAWVLRGPGDFEDEGIRNTMASTMVLRDETGSPVAFATRLSAVARDDNLLLGSLNMRTYWNVFWPNQGSVYMQSEETRREIFRDGASAFLGGGDIDASDNDYVLTVDSAGNRVAGVSGNFIGASGAYAEVLLSSEDGRDIQQGELSIRLDR